MTLPLLQIGSRYGRLIIVKNYIQQKGNINCECLCDCGKTQVIMSASLRNGKTNSCGCLHQERAEGQLVQSTESSIDRFWSKVDKRSPESCWEWTAKANSKGYGTIRVGGKTTIASRFSYALVNGPIPEGLIICHKCDNPPCVNPSHLFLGTHLDNCIDKYIKKRNVNVKGEKSGMSKITREQADMIRVSKESLRELGKKLGMTYGNVGKIRRGEIWAI